MTTLFLEGEEGLVEGEMFALEPGETAIIGRSRSCGISLRSCASVAEMSDEERKEDKDFLTVSRKHLEITYHDSENVELLDQSTHGSHLNGKRFEQVKLNDVGESTYRLRLGKRETFLLTLSDSLESPEGEEDDQAT